MMQDDDGRLVEAIADTLFECDGMPNLTRQDIARAALSAIEREGYVIRLKEDVPNRLSWAAPKQV